MKEKIFISHATPDDNDFTRWLALKLIALGYDVWCDVLFLDKGVDFWSKIENVIRENTCKFLIVSSNFSNQREGVLKELAVAAKVKKQTQDETFIIPLAIDNNLSYDDINIDIVRLNGIDFKKSWASGLRDLLETFEKENVHRNAPDHEKTSLLYQQIFLHDKGVVEKEEIYHSNWFPIIEFPEELRFHFFDKKIPYGFDVRELTFPAIKYKKYLCTFAYAYDFMHQLPKTETYSQTNTIRIPTSEILSGEYNDSFISNGECQRLIVQLVNKAFELQMKNNNLRDYHMSNKYGYWFEKGTLEKDKFNKVQMVGKMKEKNWHFGISASGKLYPFPTLVISSHIYFTKDGINIIESKSIQHAARRKKGKGWWNNDWRAKLMGFVKYLASDNENFHLEVGSEEKIYVSAEPMSFVGNVTYTIPEKNTLEEEAEIAEMSNLSIIDENEEENFI